MKKQGLTLIEVLIAMTILSISIIGVVSIVINSVKINDMASRQLIVKERAGAEIERIKVMGYFGITPDNMANIGYVTWDNLGGTYQLPGIPQDFGAPYNWCLFRGIDVAKTIDGQTKHYYYTLKISVEEDFVESFARRIKMDAYWIFENKLKNIEIIFVVGHRR
ncbi:prepilin-type N-terminal cleavage/methylation domain-containing protein [bacterium]|nr:prepilin-type N-terminal cleavage/methylation domain-containing protein [bacterium]MBU1600141.1 prepilin-type N-terminal cleavage/methylation domain-containing protein [bacterium]MBU2462051.1 prepilin-type N-terminal cleavage/methylation domain-containing protein [bacterium]